MNRLSHRDVEMIVREYVPELQHLFADRWERWPDEQHAYQLVNRLRTRADGWRQNGFPEISAKIHAAADEIVTRSKESYYQEPRY